MGSKQSIKIYKFQKKSLLWSLLISVYRDDCGTFTLREWLYSKWKNTIIIRIKFSFLLCLTCSKLYDWAVFSFVVSADVSEIDVNTFLGPFLDVIRSEDTTGPITGVALSSVNKFLSYGLIGTVYMKFTHYKGVVDTKTTWFCGVSIQKLENQNLAQKLTWGFLLLSPSIVD